MVKNAQNQAALIEDILDLSRAAQGRLSVEFAIVDFAQVVKAAVAGAQPSAEEKKLMLREEVELTGGCPVHGDANRLQQVVSNLLSNAVKFTPEDGTVTVRLRRDNGYAELMVADTGRGIEPKFLALIFERFNQADAGAARISSGLGLGLSISRQLVALHNGTITASSEGEGKGATFTVRLPLRSSLQKGGLPSESQAESRPSLAGIKVLLVDDNNDTRDLMVEVLNNCGATTIPAASAQAALDALRDTKPDVLVSDIGMPLEDGYSLIRKIRILSREQGGGIPACALTGWSSASERERAISAGYQLHLTKPANTERLIAAICTLAKSTIHQ